MDPMYIILMPFFVCLFWTVIIGTDLKKKEYRRHRAYLLVFFTAATLLYFGHSIYFSRNTSWLPLTDWIYATCNIAVYPLWYLYICSLTQKRLTVTWQLIVMLPTLLSSIAVATLYIIMSKEDTRLFIDCFLYSSHSELLTTPAQIQALIHTICKVVFALQIIPVLYVGYTKIRGFNKYVKSIYSDVEDKLLPSHINHLLVLFFITSIVSFIANILGRNQFIDSTLMLSLPSFIFSVLLFSIGYVCYFHTFSIDDIDLDNQQADELIEESAKPSELRIRIEKVMEEEKIYLQPNLKLQDLVRYVQSNRNYVYNAINKEMGVSFNEYVNRLRVEYSERLLTQHPNISLSEIAEKSGFTSTASFYRNFKMFTGKSPKEYQQKA